MEKPTEITAVQLHQNPEKIDAYIEETFDTFVASDDAVTFMGSLHNIVQVKGFAAVAEKAGVDIAELETAFSDKRKPTVRAVWLITRGLGYRMRLKKIEAAAL